VPADKAMGELFVIGSKVDFPVTLTIEIICKGKKPEANNRQPGAF